MSLLGCGLAARILNEGVELKKSTLVSEKVSGFIRELDNVVLYRLLTFGKEIKDEKVKYLVTNNFYTAFQDFIQVLNECNGVLQYSEHLEKEEKEEKKEESE